METIGERLKRLRTEILDISQKEMGRLAGKISKAAVSQWEHGTSSPERDALLSLQKEKNIDPEWVMTGKGEPFLGQGIREGQAEYSPAAAALSKRIERLPDHLRAIIEATLAAAERAAQGGHPQSPDEEKPATIYPPLKDVGGASSQPPHDIHRVIKPHGDKNQKSK